MNSYSFKSCGKIIFRNRRKWLANFLALFLTVLFVLRWTQNRYCWTKEAFHMLNQEPEEEDGVAADIIKATMCKSLNNSGERLYSDWSFSHPVICPQLPLQIGYQQRKKIVINCNTEPPTVLEMQTHRTDDIYQIPFNDQQSCLRAVIESHCMDGHAVPNVFNSVWYTAKEMNFFYFLNLMSVIRFMKPCFILIHGEFLPFGKYWDHVVNNFPNIIHVWRKRPQTIFGNQLQFMEHSSDVMRIEALKVYGGLYTDADSVLLRPIDDLRNCEVTMGLEFPTRMGSQFALSVKDAPFMDLWHKSYRDDYSICWAYNAQDIPYEIAVSHPSLIHIDGFNFTRPGFFRKSLIHDENYKWDLNYAMHLFAQFYKKEISFEDARTLNTTIGAVSRHILFGNKELCSS